MKSLLFDYLRLIHSQIFFKKTATTSIIIHIEIRSICMRLYYICMYYMLCIHLFYTLNILSLYIEVIYRQVVIYINEQIDREMSRQIQTNMQCLDKHSLCTHYRYCTFIARLHSHFRRQITFNQGCCRSTEEDTLAIRPSQKQLLIFQVKFILQMK